MTRPRRAAIRLTIVLAAVVALLAIVRPWTVVRVSTTPLRAFSAIAYVDGIWSRSVLADAERSAVTLRTALAATAAESAPGPDRPRQSLFIADSARVAAIDSRSRVGLATLDMSAVRPAASGPGVAIQIGPVIRGTALRDALPSIRFGDFANQLQFADVATALNDRVLATVLAHLDPQTLVGRQVSFLGAVTIGGSDGARDLAIVPLRLTMDRPEPGRG